MRRISNFEQFVNEGYLQKIGSTISKWAKSIKDAVKSGLARLIPSGPKKGLPVYMFFSGDDGSILDQVNSFYAGTEFSKMNNLETGPSVDEAKVPLSYPVEDDVLNSNEKEIKADIKRNLRALLKAAEIEDPESRDEAIKDIKPYFIFGAPGIGKTQIVAQVCDELGKELYGKRLHLHNVDGENAEPVDFSGVPKVIDIEAPSEENPVGRGVTRSNVSADQLPFDNGPGDRGGIIFIDELNRMPDQVIKIFMKLAQSRRLGQGYNIPSKWYIVAAGNRKADDPREVKELGTALRDRFEIVNFVPTPAGWRSYIEGGRLKDIVLPELMDFIDFDSEWFHNLDPAVKKSKFPTPRAWVDASFALKRRLDELQAEAKSKGKELNTIPDDVIIREFTKSVGKDAAVAFLNFYKVAKDIPVKDLVYPFTDPEKAPDPYAKGKNRADYIHALFSAVLRKSTEMQLTSKEVCNYAQWLRKINDPEWGASCIASIMKLHPYLKKDSTSIRCLAPLADQWQADLGVDF
jgi:hypothetical protein